MSWKLPPDATREQADVYAEKWKKEMQRLMNNVDKHYDKRNVRLESKRIFHAALDRTTKICADARSSVAAMEDPRVGAHLAVDLLCVANTELEVGHLLGLPEPIFKLSGVRKLVDSLKGFFMELRESLSKNLVALAGEVQMDDLRRWKTLWAWITERCLDPLDASTAQEIVNPDFSSFCLDLRNQVLEELLKKPSEEELQMGKVEKARAKREVVAKQVEDAENRVAETEKALKSQKKGLKAHKNKLKKNDAEVTEAEAKLAEVQKRGHSEGTAAGPQAKRAKK